MLFIKVVVAGIVSLAIITVVKHDEVAEITADSAGGRKDSDNGLYG